MFQPYKLQRDNVLDINSTSLGKLLHKFRGTNNERYPVSVQFNSNCNIN